MFGYGLHDGTIDDDQVLGSSFHVTSLARIARIKEQRRPFETNPVTAPSSLPGQLHLVFLAQQPLLDAQKPVKKKKNYNNKKKNQSGEMHPTGWRRMFQSTHRRSHANHKNIFIDIRVMDKRCGLDCSPIGSFNPLGCIFFPPHPDIPSCQINLMPAASGNNHPHSSKKRNKATVHRVCRPATHSHTHTHTHRGREGGRWFQGEKESIRDDARDGARIAAIRQKTLAARS